MTAKNMIETVRDTLMARMRRDPSMIVLGEDVGRAGGVFHATEGLIEEFGEHRVIDTPLAESGIVGIAVGAAMAGLRPVVEIQFADFIHSAVDQIINEAAKIRYRSNNGYACPLVIRVPYGAGIAGGLYHSQSVEALFFSTPGLKIVAPCTPYDMAGLLAAAIDDPDPVLFLEHKRSYRAIKGEVPDCDDHMLPIGVADIKQEGTQATVVTYGMMVHDALAVAQRLALEGMSVEVLDLRTLRPMDEATIVHSVRKTGRLLIAHEDNLTGGIGGEVAALVADQCFLYLDAPVKRLGSPDIPTMPYNHLVEAELLPGERQLEVSLRELIRY
ncbi:MAG: alpha-ketoacid dehydrogenase subunit beta [Limnochordia bacterium]|jgi:2-oxoisovalerate dehydrogenase E1 component beta subunit